MTPKDIAKKAAETMWQKDRSSKWVGLKMEQGDVGEATLSLEVQQHHTNGHDICHGGIIFMLADTAFAIACNSRNQATVAQHNTITFIKTAILGDKLVAHAREISISGRTGIYDVTVKNKRADVIAEFRGCSRTINGQIFNED